MDKNKNLELTISIKEQTKFDFFIKLLQEFSYVEIVDIKENEVVLTPEYKMLLKERLERIEKGETTVKSWDLMKEKYEKTGL